MATTFKKQIERNLVFLKKERENRKKTEQPNTSKYNSPRYLTFEHETSHRDSKPYHKCRTDHDDVFTKLN